MKNLTIPAFGLIILLIPLGVTLTFGHFSRNASETTPNTAYNPAILQPYTLPQSDFNLEAYVIGVVAAEMPALFEFEALKAQAIAARTYSVYRGANSKDIGQVYMSVEQMRARWGYDFYKFYGIISAAVKATEGKILVYNNRPIDALFSAMSAGTTELPENVWGAPRPYLQSVSSHFDRNAPNFTYVRRIPKTEVGQRLGGNNITQINILSRTAADYVATVSAGGLTLSGVEVRRLLGLRSSSFTVETCGEYFVFTTQGHGHGVGLSQYGAHFMAQAGYTYRQILKHYYTGVEIVSLKFVL